MLKGGGGIPRLEEGKGKAVNLKRDREEEPLDFPQEGKGIITLRKGSTYQRFPPKKEKLVQAIDEKKRILLKRGKRKNGPSFSPNEESFQKSLELTIKKGTKPIGKRKRGNPHRKKEKELLLCSKGKNDKGLRDKTEQKRLEEMCPLLFGRKEVVINEGEGGALPSGRRTPKEERAADPREDFLPAWKIKRRNWLHSRKKEAVSITGGEKKKKEFLSGAKVRRRGMDGHNTRHAHPSSQ